MSDLRIPTAELNVGGTTYTVTCNMNVLADIQEAADGDFVSVLSGKKSFRSALIIGAALINESNALAGKPERITPDKLGRMVEPAKANEFSSACVGIIYKALAPGEDNEQEETEPTEKN